MSEQENGGVPQMKLFYQPEGRLRLTLEDRISYLTVKPAWAAPLTHPGKYLGLVDGKGKQILMIKEPEELPSEHLAILREELRRRYMNATVQKVTSVRTEFRVTYWSVETDRGHRDFVTQSLQENAQWIGPQHLLLIDVDGNRFEVPNTMALDPASRKRLYSVV